jgi:glycosyltransferase involved in cell wall biosynthesis
MRILFIAPTPFFADRGCHVRIYEEIKSLQNLGNEIILCTYGLGREVEGVDTVRTINFPWYKKLEAGPSKTKILLLPFLFLTVFKTVINFKPMIIYAHLHEGAIIARLIKLFFPKKKYFFDMQGSLANELLQHRFIKEGSLFYKFFLFFEKRITNWFHIIASSPNYKSEFERLGINANRYNISVIGDGVDTSIFKPQRFNRTIGDRYNIKRTSVRVLYMGLLEEYQGVDLMLESFRIVKEKHPDIVFIIIGYPNIDRYRNITKLKGLDKNIRFLGKIDYNKIPQYLSLSEIAIAPKISESEGDGKLFNYLSMGMCTITWNRELSKSIAGDAAIYCEYQNTKDMANKILLAIEDESLRKEYQIKARERAVNYLAWSITGDRINKLLRGNE